MRRLLTVTDLGAGYGEGRVLFDVSLGVAEGEVVTLLGRNGMGKTTTVLAIMGIIPTAAGRVSFDGAILTGLPSYKIARCGIGLVPEGRQVFPNLTVQENLTIGAPTRTATASQWTLDRILELFPLLRARLAKPGNLLSGGEQQMLAIGRALMTNPKLLIFDEAAEGLAPRVRRQIWQVIESIKASGLAILIIDKNVEALTRIATRHHILERGRIVWTGSSDELRRDAALKRRYLSI